MGLPIGPVLPRHQRQPHARRLGGERPLRAAPRHRHHRQCDGRRRAEQFRAARRRWATLSGEVSVERVDDDAIRARIAADFHAERLCLVPAFGDRRRSLCPAAAPRCGTSAPGSLCATAHPFKFAEIVEPLIGRPHRAAARARRDPGRARRMPVPIPATAGSAGERAGRLSYCSLSAVSPSRAIGERIYCRMVRFSPSRSTSAVMPTPIGIWRPLVSRRKLTLVRTFTV